METVQDIDAIITSAEFTTAEIIFAMHMYNCVGYSNAVSLPDLCSYLRLQFMREYDLKEICKCLIHGVMHGRFVCIHVQDQTQDQKCVRGVDIPKDFDVGYRFGLCANMLLINYESNKKYKSFANKFLKPGEPIKN